MAALQTPWTHFRHCAATIGGDLDVTGQAGIPLNQDTEYQVWFTNKWGLS
jgi:hypothetical protein